MILEDSAFNKNPVSDVESKVICYETIGHETASMLSLSQLCGVI